MELSDRIKRLEEREKYETLVINQRTSAFLVTQGLLAVAVGSSRGTVAGELILALASLVLATLWLICTSLSLRVLSKITQAGIDLDSNDDVIVAKRSAMGPRHPFRPSFIMAVWLPLVFILGWFSYIVWVIVAN